MSKKELYILLFSVFAISLLLSKTLTDVLIVCLWIISIVGMEYLFEDFK